MNSSGIQKMVAEKIRETLEKQRFADWYNKGRFDAYISGVVPKEGVLNHITKDEILGDIVKIFDL